ncbi:Ubiquitin C-terminal hydrolase [Chitinophaga sp. YR627]|uniref:ubiquitin carboxyl-terminal hydrolase n=1 Tax=Chitinophaga sp. YR627 TaxID=1881041 RepID=UPI0008F349DC|nr:ubiquitin carboxyl-terminal hydrolase [Chitinophaga sp. YR627]SFM85191.1 Ubiquitin C-terminal hydrolase [Chitinophaga sp. YR627]
MPLEHSSEKTVHNKDRAVAHHSNNPAVSRPAVPAIQKMSEDKQGEEAGMEELAEDAAIPAKFSLPADNNNEPAAFPGVQPFQLRSGNTAMAAGPVVQLKKLLITAPGRGRKNDVVISMEHDELIKVIKPPRVRRPANGRMTISIGGKPPKYVPIDNVIAAVQKAMNAMDVDGKVFNELKMLLGVLTDQKNAKPRTRSKKRKREASPVRDVKRPKKKDKVMRDLKEKEAYEALEEVKENDAQVKDLTTVEQEVKPIGPDEPLKFVAWNLNHFGEGKNLSEKEIIAKIREFAPNGGVRDMKEYIMYDRTSGMIEEFLNVLARYTGKLPLFTNITEVSLLMDAIGNLKYILERVGKSNKYYGGKYTIIEEIAGSLKKHYILAHSRSLLKQHPSLIMGFNEVGEGVDTMKQKLEGKTKEEPKGSGIQVEKGPRLQSISISVPLLIDAVSVHNMFAEKKDRIPEYLVEKKDRYSVADRWDHSEAYTRLGPKTDYLRNGQIEYYPVAFNSGVFEYKGAMIVSGTEIVPVEDGEDIVWTKNPGLGGYYMFRPIVVHKFALKTEKKEEEGTDIIMGMSEGNNAPAGKDVWFGMVHTSPHGDEFDRREIYVNQLSESIPALRDQAAGNNAQLVIGGDYYIAEEALITSPPTLQYEGNNYQDENGFKMERSELNKRPGLTVGRNVGKSGRVETTRKVGMKPGTGTDSKTEMQSGELTNVDTEMQPETVAKTDNETGVVTNAKPEMDVKKDTATEKKKEEEEEPYVTGKMNEIRNMVHPLTDEPYNFKDTLSKEKMKDVRSMTGTNENSLGLQSADYFIVDKSSSKTYQTGIIDPVTGIPFYMESDNREMSDAWFAFSDHVPVMLVVSPKENAKSVGNAFAGNKGYFNNDPSNLNLFDLRYLQISNGMARIREDITLYPKMQVDYLEARFAEVQQVRKLGVIPENAQIFMNQLMINIDKVIAGKKKRMDISTEMFEVYQAREAYITTALYQIWSDIYSIREEHDNKLLEHIQDVRMILKEEKINALNTRGEGMGNEASKEAREVLGKYVQKSSLDKIDETFEVLIDPLLIDRHMVMEEFLRLKSELTTVLLQGLLEQMGVYVNAMMEDESTDKGKKQVNIRSNYNLFVELAGNTGTTHKVRTKHDRNFSGDVYEEDLKDTPRELALFGGIPNRGNDCFLNSLCQLLTLPAYQTLALDFDVRDFINKIGKPERIRRVDVRELRLYLFALNRVQTMGGQEDATELLGKLMDEIEPLLVGDRKQYDETFKVLSSYKRTITEIPPDHSYDWPIDPGVVQWVDNEKTTDQAPENILYVPVDNAQGLSDWLQYPKRQYSFQPGMEWAVMNDQWHSVTKMEEVVIFKRLPAVLTIALNRFGNDLQKISRPFEMPLKFSQISDDGGTRMEHFYELQGFVYHQGDTRGGGHYWMHKKQGDSWLKAEDAQVEHSTLGESDKEGTFTHDINNAYIYTYFRTHMAPPRDIQPVVSQDAHMEEEEEDKKETPVTGVVSDTNEQQEYFFM